MSLLKSSRLHRRDTVNLAAWDREMQHLFLLDGRFFCCKSDGRSMILSAPMVVRSRQVPPASRRLPPHQSPDCDPCYDADICVARSPKGGYGIPRRPVVGKTAVFLEVWGIGANNEFFARSANRCLAISGESAFISMSTASLPCLIAARPVVPMPAMGRELSRHWIADNAGASMFPTNAATGHHTAGSNRVRRCPPGRANCNTAVTGNAAMERVALARWQNGAAIACVDCICPSW